MIDLTFPTDGPLVGSPQILHESRRVILPPATINQPVPVPSVFRDARGEIHNFVIGPQRLNLLHTKAGVMRSGDIHKDTQHDFVFRGKVNVWTLTPNGSTAKKVYGPNEYIAIPPYTPHVFEFLEDSVIAEWWDGPFQAWFYEPYRKVVQASFVASKGRLARYAIMDHHPLSIFRNDKQLQFWWTGLVIGVTLGYFWGKHHRP